jgi:cell division protein FtsW (lipid II flippase)
MQMLRKTVQPQDADGTKQFRLPVKINLAEDRLFLAAALFLLLNAVVLTAAPAVRSHNVSDFRWGHWIGFFVWLVSFSSIHFFCVKFRIEADAVLLSITALLVGWGLLSIFRVDPYFGLRQTTWIAVGTLIFLLGLRLPVDLGFLRSYKYMLLVGGLGLTALTLIFGTNPMGYGPRLWLSIGDFYFQPSEPLKLLLVIYLAAYFADRQPFINQLPPLIAPTAILAAGTLGLLVVQRDLGTASIFIVIYAGMIYLATGKRRMLLFSLVFLVAAGLAGYLLFDLVQLRVEAWIDPWLDPSGRSYQIIQSLLAISAGGVGGRGIGLGSPNLVPIAHSDFIFSTIAEEFGLVGSLALILALILLVFRGFKIGLTAGSFFHRYLALGISIYLASQSILIIGGNIRLLPLTGVTLPFVSYGGSSLVTSMAAILVLTKINQKNQGSARSKLGRTAPVFHIAAILLAGFAALALIDSWWAVWRGPDLLTRTDNARRTLSDYDVPRGEIFDRDGRLLTATEGQAGSYFRVYHYPSMSTVLGYTNPFYGQAGSEASLDEILRGLENNDPWTVWINHLLYGQSPAGLDAKISLDLDLQILADELFGIQPGALVLLNAESGEILAMHSAPGYDANTLAEDWESLIEREDSPLLNRVVQGHYPVGMALSPFLLAAAQPDGMLPETISTLDIVIDGRSLTCSQPVELPTTWPEAIAAACPAPAAALGVELGAEKLENLYGNMGLYTAPPVRLPLAQPSVPQTFSLPEIAAVGQTDLTISPLQLALAAAAFSNEGLMPAPHFLLAAENPQGGWTAYPPEAEAVQLFKTQAANQTAALLSPPESSYWETAAFAYAQSGQRLTWYLAGTLPGAEKPLVVVVLLEYYAPRIIQDLGRQMLDAAITQ